MILKNREIFKSGKKRKYVGYIQSTEGACVYVYSNQLVIKKSVQLIAQTMSNFDMVYLFICTDFLYLCNFLHILTVRKNAQKIMGDITKDELKDKGKEKALVMIKNTLELAGLDPSDYDLSLRKKSHPKSAPNIQVFQTAAYLAATCLSPSAAKIFLYFLSMSEFENFVGVSHHETISEETGIKRRTVVSALNELASNGIIIKAKNKQDKRLVDYFLNPMSAWKGKTLNRKIALQKAFHEDKNQLHLFGETYEENIIREAEEIKKKRPNLFLTGGSK